MRRPKTADDRREQSESPDDVPDPDVIEEGLNSVGDIEYDDQSETDDAE